MWLGVGECDDNKKGGVYSWDWGCEKMKGFQMHLFVYGAPTPVFFFIMCTKVVYILLFLFVGIFVFAHVRMYVFVLFVLCYRNFHIRVQLANTIVALATLCCHFYLCTPLSPAGVVSEQTGPIHSAL